MHHSGIVTLFSAFLATLCAIAVWPQPIAAQERAERVEVRGAIGTTVASFAGDGHDWIRGQPASAPSAPDTVESATTPEQWVQSQLGSRTAAYLLAIVGVVAILIEIATPGGFVPGLLGVVTLAFAAIGIGLSWEATVPLALVLAAGIAVVAWRGRTLRGRSSPTGREGMVGKEGVTLSPTGPDGGGALIAGERWRVIAPRPIRAGTRVRVVRIEGLTLQVEPATNRGER